MPHFDGTISAGSLLTAASMLVMVIVFVVRIAEVQANQAKIIEAQSKIVGELRKEFHEHEGKDDLRFERLENRILDLVAGLQRLVGRAEVFRTRPRDT